MFLHLAQTVLTAILASGLTLGVGWWLWERRFRRRLEEELERRLAEVGEGLGREIQERVRRGVLEGVSSISTADVLRGTQRGLTETAAGLVRGGLSSILGPGERRRGAPERGGDRKEEGGGRDDGERE